MRRLFLNHRGHNIGTILLAIALALALFFSIVNAIKLGKFAITGDIGIITTITPQPFYGTPPSYDAAPNLNNKPLITNRQRYGGLDFCSNVGCAKETCVNLCPDYYKLQPATTFSPHFYYIFYHSFSAWPFGISYFLYYFLQILFFFACWYYFIKTSPYKKENKNIANIIGGVVALGLMFLTTIGVTAFERGQAYIWLAGAMILVIKSFRDKKIIDFFMAGIIISAKTSFWPLVTYFVFLKFLFLLKPYFVHHRHSFLGLLTFIVKTLKTHRKEILCSALFIAPFLFSFLLPNALLLSYLGSMKTMASYTTQVSYISLYNLIKHPLLVNLVPFFIIFLYFILSIIHEKKYQKHFQQTNYGMEIIFLTLLAWLYTTSGSAIWEYNKMSLLFIIPLLANRYSFINNNARTTPLPPIFWVVLVLLIAIIFRIILFPAKIVTPYSRIHSILPLFSLSMFLLTYLFYLVWPIKRKTTLQK